LQQPRVVGKLGRSLLGRKVRKLIFAVLLLLALSTLVMGPARAQTSGYVPPPRGAPDGRVGGASRAIDSNEHRVALVIGNGAYQHLPRLDNPENDAQLMAKTLKLMGFELIGDGALTDLDRQGFEKAIRKFGSELSGGGVGLFYYAGHGVQIQGTNYLIPVSANPTGAADVDFELIDAGLVLRQMEAAGSKLNFVLLDACRNNPFGGRRLRDAHGGLAQMRAPTGTLISYATQPGNVAADGANGHSPYTQALVEAMQKPGLGVFEVFNTAAVTVKNETRGDQQPWVSNSPIEGNFFFVGPTAVTVSPPPAPDRDIVFWESIKGSNDPADFEDFIKRYPDSEFASIAKRRIEALKTSVASVARIVPPPPAAPPPGAPAMPEIDAKEIARNLQGELKRVGCYNGAVDGVWGPLAQTAVEHFNQHTGKHLKAETASVDATASIKESKGRVCPLPPPPPPPLHRQAAAPAVERSYAPVEPQRVLPPAPVAPPPAPVAPRPAGKCFAFGGKQYCE
jgi:Na+-transporting methylmalonyl-CoA/oxaloacetate decarboxylase gamma subunit